MVKIYRLGTIHKQKVSLQSAEQLNYVQALNVSARTLKINASR